MMRRIKRRFEHFLLYDYSGMEAHLAKMARTGWQIQKITPLYWDYHRIEPQPLTYTVTYFSEASDFNPGPTQNQQTFYAYCEEAGWQLVAQQAQMQVFCSNQPNTTPIETDATVKLEAIHRSMTKNFLFGNVVSLVLFLFILALQYKLFSQNPVDTLSSTLSLCTLLLIIIQFVQILTSIIGYVVWYYRSQKSIRVGGGCIENSSGFPKIYLIMRALLATIIVVSALMLSSQQFGWVGIIGILNTVVVIAGILFIRDVLKRKKVARRTNEAITLVICLLLPVVLTGVMGWGILQGLHSGWLHGKPVDTYTTVQSNGSTYTWDIYHDDLPLIVEDLQEVNYDHYSYEWKKEETILLARSIGRQDSFPDGQDAPALRYEIVKVKMPILFQLCLNDYLTQYDYAWEPVEYRRYYLMTNDPVWKADAVYQIYDGGEARAEYLLHWDNIIVSIRFDEIPTPEQIAIVKEKLSQ